MTSGVHEKDVGGEVQCIYGVPHPTGKLFTQVMFSLLLGGPGPSNLIVDSPKFMVRCHYCVQDSI